MRLRGWNNLLVLLWVVFCFLWVIELRTATLHLPQEIKVKSWATYPYRSERGLAVFVTFKYQGKTYYVPISNIALIYEEK
jgi:hypothetical protein